MSVAGTFNIGASVKNYLTSDSLGTYSGVNLWVAEDSADQLTVEQIEEVAPGGTFEDKEGNIIGYKSNPWSTNGRVIDVVNPFASPQMASDILAGMIYSSGVAMEYKPFSADTLIPPHFELGDAVIINNTHHGIYSFVSEASRLALSSLKAPADEEIDHEYPFKSDVKSRQITRKFGAVQAQFAVQAGMIAAKVSREGENGNRTFGWSLTENGFYINNGEVRADGSDLFTFDSTGLHIKGDIEAVTGHIGGDRGFTIESGKLYSGKDSFSGTGNGVYIGTDGISLGSGFSVSTSGNLTASRGTFGSLSVDSGGRTGGSYHGGLSGCGGSLGTGIKIGSTPIGTYVENLIANTVTAQYITTKIASSSISTSGNLRVSGSFTCDGNFYFKRHTISAGTIKDGNGNNQNVLKWS